MREREGLPRVSIYPILAVNFVGTLGFSIVLPFLVFLVTRWGGNAFVYGVMGATYSVFQLVGAPILGRWSDVHGRRKILLLSQLGTLLSWGIFLIAFALPTHTLWSVDSGLVGQFALTLPLAVLFLARAFDGLTGGNISVANAYLADVSNDDTRNANFGKMAVSSNIGFILGPALAGVLAGTVWGELLPVLAAFAISAVASLMILFRLPESRPCVLAADPEQMNVGNVLGQDHKPCFEMAAAAKLSFRGVLGLPGVPLVLGIYFMVMLGFNFFYIAFPVHAVRDLQWSVRDTGIFFVVMGSLMVLVQGPVLGRLSKRWSDNALAVAGSLVLAVAFPFFCSPNLVVTYTGVVLLALGNGLMWPSVVSILSRTAGEKYQGAVQGVAGSAGAVASVVGLVLGGALFELLNVRIFVLSAVVILGVFFLSLRIGRAAVAQEPVTDRRDL